MDIDKFLIEFQKTWDRKHNMKELINTLQNKKFMKKANNKIRTNKFSQPRGASKKYYYFKDYYKPKKKYSSFSDYFETRNSDRCYNKGLYYYNDPSQNEVLEAELAFKKSICKNRYNPDATFLLSQMREAGDISNCKLNCTCCGCLKNHTDDECPICNSNSTN